MRVTLARLRSHGRVRALGRVRIGSGVRFHLAPGAVVTLEDRCEIGAGTRFHVHGQARIGAGAVPPTVDRSITPVLDNQATGAPAKGTQPAPVAAPVG